MKKKYSLRIELVTILIIFVVGMLGLIYLFQTTFLDDFYKKSKINTIENVANKVSSSIGDKSLEDIIDEELMSSEVCVRVVSNDPKLNIAKACTLKNVDNQTINNIASEAIKNGGEKLFTNIKYQRKLEQVLDNIYIYAKMLTYNNQYVLVLVSSVITPLTATISTIKSQYIIIVAVVILMAIVLALLLSRFIIKPIKSINEESKNLAKGEYNGNNLAFKTEEFSQLNQTLSNANQDILKADKARKELLGNVSHDLRTPLTMIVGYGEMIRDLPEENNESNINVIIDEAKRLSTLVDDLIDISSLESDNVQIHKNSISVCDLLSSVYHQYEKYCKASDVRFELKLQEDINVDVDEHRIKQVLYNFINNALNYNDKDDKYIELGFEVLSDKCRVYVYDNGNGIDVKDIDNIWDRYYKVDKQHKRQHIGSGIGLSLSKQLLIGHGFNYGVDSKINEYSKFYFDIAI